MSEIAALGLPHRVVPLAAGEETSLRWSPRATTKVVKGVTEERGSTVVVTIRVQQRVEVHEPSRPAALA